MIDFLQDCKQGYQLHKRYQLCKSTMITPGSCWVHLRTHDTAMSCWQSPVTASRGKSPWQRQAVHCWPQSTSATKASSPWWSSSGRTAATGGHQGTLVIVERLEHLVLSVYCFPSYCLLTPLMSLKDKKCKLIDWLKLIDITIWQGFVLCP